MRQPSNAGEDTPPEEQLRLKIIDQLAWNPRLRNSDIQVTISGTKVRLTGIVPSLRARIEATEAAWSVWGVTAVANDLRVAPFVQLVDPFIKHEVENSLEIDTYIDRNDITVSVQDGGVTLRGTVDELWKRQHVEERVAALRGVVEVTNELTIVPTLRPGDEKIAQDIMAAIRRSGMVAADDVNILVSYGKVTLTGTVPSYAAWRAARDAAWYTVGVSEVDDRLVIDYSLPPMAKGPEQSEGS
jgi:osmotically-inducible protein OsmY